MYNSRGVELCRIYLCMYICIFIAYKKLHSRCKKDRILVYRIACFNRIRLLYLVQISV